MKSKIKVLQVIPRLDFGGAETGCYDLAHYLAEQECKSYIITSGGKLLNYIKKDKVKVIRLPVHLKNPLFILINFLIITFIILILNINLVHARSRAPAWSCLFATKITRRKFATTFHGTYNFKSNLKKFYNSVMVRSNLVIAGSNFIFSHIQNNYKKFFEDEKRKVLVIFRGINTEYFNTKRVNQNKVSVFMDQWKLDQNNYNILMPGRLTNWKGQSVFIEALNLLSSLDTVPFNGIILGGDQGRKIYRKKLEALVQQYRLGKKIKFISHCSEMPVAYKAADLIVSASIEPEAFGRTSVEAQSMGKIIIASNIGGSKETVVNEKTGFFFESGNAQNLADTIKKVMRLDNNTLQSMGSEGRKNVLKKFDVEKMCNSTFSEYKKLLKYN